MNRELSIVSLPLKAVNCPAVNSFVVGEVAVGDGKSFETQKADRTCTPFIISLRWQRCR